MSRPDLSKEVRIKLDDYFISIPRAQEKKNEFSDRFCWVSSNQDPVSQSNREPLEPVHASVVMREFNKLYNEAEAEARDNDVIDGEYFTALRVHLGISSDKRIILWYEPTYVKGKASANTFIGNISSCRNTGDFDRYSDSPEEDFITESAANISGPVQAYRENIAIKRFSTGTTYRRPCDADDWTGDTRSALYSFQALYKLYELNYVDTGIDPNFNGTEQIRVISGSVPISPPVGVTGYNRYKHTIMFSIIPVQIKEVPAGDEPDKDQLANLGHICPPATDCNTITVPI